jgi:hypothetical protein
MFGPVNGLQCLIFSNLHAIFSFTNELAVRIPKHVQRYGLPELSCEPEIREPLTGGKAG